MLFEVKFVMGSFHHNLPHAHSPILPVNANIGKDTTVIYLDIQGKQNPQKCCPLWYEIRHVCQCLYPTPHTQLIL
jgi:hypothetical protein